MIPAEKNKKSDVSLVSSNSPWFVFIVYLILFMLLIWVVRGGISILMAV